MSWSHIIVKESLVFLFFSQIKCQDEWWRTSDEPIDLQLTLKHVLDYGWKPENERKQRDWD